MPSEKLWLYVLLGVCFAGALILLAPIALRIFGLITSGVTLNLP